MKYGSASIGKLIYSLLSGILPVYPSVAPQNASIPYCVYDIVNTQADSVKESASWCDTVTVILWIFCTTLSECATKATAIRTAIDGNTGYIAGLSSDGMFFSTEGDDYDSDLNLYIKSLEYRIRIVNT